MENNYEKLEKKIGISFKDKSLLEKAFTHKSYLNEHRNENIEDNERLEFLGDAVLELASTKHLFLNYPNKQEGEMTTFRSALVRGNHLAEIGEKLDLGKYLLLSHGEEKSGGRDKKYILANTLEALIGGIYLDQGYTEAEGFIKKFILVELDEITKKGLHIEAKSQLQETCQEKEDFTPYYEVLSEEGPDHAKKFTVGVYIEDKLVAKGEDSSKQKAENKAAQNALKIKKWK
ncbi:ribonuclease III [Candidatus Peregrinibacteria bacterium]|nr:ribonuclease III [Candidatus Peregrinibacteria bacterium]